MLAGPFRQQAAVSHWQTEGSSFLNKKGLAPFNCILVTFNTNYNVVHLHKLFGKN